MTDLTTPSDNDTAADVICLSTIFTWQAYNALFVIRNLCKYFVENLTEDVVLEQFRTVGTDGKVFLLLVIY